MGTNITKFHKELVVYGMCIEQEASNNFLDAIGGGVVQERAVRRIICLNFGNHSWIQSGDRARVDAWWERDGCVGEGVCECNLSWSGDTFSVGSPNQGLCL